MGWLKERRRRRRILRSPFAPEWREHLERNMLHFGWLDPAEREKLCGLVKEFVAKKHFEAFGGLELTDEIPVTIAGQACLLVLGLDHVLYRNVETIYVYPSTVVPKRVDDPYFATATVSRGVMPLLGEAHHRGPVVLAWDAVRRGGRHPDLGPNLVYHEFAHKLDMLDGSVDGVPPLESREQYERWQRVCEAEYARLRESAERGEETLLDPYGAVSAGEFFAVVTELFFDKPLAMQREHPELYDVLSGFYRQDPALREQRALTADLA